MAKKQVGADTIEALVVMTEESASEPRPALTLPSYILGQWNGMPMWRCQVCLYDTLDGEGAILEHMRAHPGPAAPALPAPEARVDKFGNPW